MSPAAHTPGADVASVGEQRTPPLSPSSSFADRASMTSGTAPVPITTMSAGSSRPDAVTTRSTRSPPSSRSTPSPQTSSTPRPRSRSAKKPPAVGPKCADSGASSSITIVQRAAERRERRRDLAGDVGPADQHDVLGLLGVGADRVRVAQRAQVVDAVELAALEPQAAHVRPCREQRHVVADDLLGRQRGGAGVRVEPHHARARGELDPLVRIPGAVVEQAGGAVHGAGEVALRGRRALVGRVGLAADEQHVAAEAPAPQRLRAGGGRDTAADDQRADPAVSHRHRRTRTSA